MMNSSSSPSRRSLAKSEVIVISRDDEPCLDDSEMLTPQSSSPLQFVQDITKSASRAVNDQFKRWEKEHTKRRISEHLAILQQARVETANACTPHARSCRSSNRLSLGDMGVALFSPLDPAFENNSAPDYYVEASSGGESTEEAEGESFVYECYDSQEDFIEEEMDARVRLLPEVTDELVPHLLTQEMMLALSQAMPAFLYTKSWKRLYSVARDGDSFGTFLSRVRGQKHTVIVVETADHEILGGFADSRWGQQAQRRDGRYYGTGTSFLFSAVIARSTEQSDAAENPVSVYNWQGVNEYSQLCRAKDGMLAMGGGGAFGLIVQDDFTRGSSGPCLTYGNVQSLTSKENFEVVGFECYGFVHTW